MSSEIIHFPQHKIVREVPVNNEVLQQAKAKSVTNFADAITDEIAENIMSDLQNCGIDTETEVFIRDMSFTIATMRAAIYRSLSVEHSLHQFIDNCVQVVPPGELNETADEEEQEEVDA